MFVCTANQFRSPIAALCFSTIIRKEMDGDEWIVGSAGTWTEAGLPAPPIAIRVARTLGVGELEGHKTRQIDQDLLDQYDLIIVMEVHHKEAILSEFPAVAGRLYMLSELATSIAYDVPDPALPGIDPEDSGRELINLIRRGKKKIIELARQKEGR
jgi:protein-tyrosine-phosphatase